MYQGKFASKDKKGSLPQREATESRPVQRPAPERRPGPDPSRPAPQRRPAPQQSRPAAPQGRPVRPVAQNFDPSRPMPPQNMAPPVRKRHYGGLIFYIIFFASILAVYTFTYIKLGDLQDWLVRYEAAQPTRKFEEVFDLYFKDPNWGLLYDNAGIPKSEYEGKEAYVAYMEEKVGDTPLTGLETSAGLSKDKKFIIRLGDEKVASFTLVDRNHATEKTDIPDWQLGEIDLFYERIGTYYINVMEGQKIQVNGVALDDSHIISIATTRAGEYLPEGITPPYTAMYQVDGLMVKPNITVTDAQGKTVESAYNAETRTFTVAEAGGAQTMDKALEERALSAIKTYAMYMSVKGGMENELAEYFKRGTELFKTFTSVERNWNQKYKDHSFSDDKVTNYVRYTYDLFSARVSTSLHLVRSDRTEKVTLLDQSMFFKKIDGKWKCIEMTAVDVSEPVEKVRLTFQNGNQVLQSEMVDASLTTVECPYVEPPAGKKFLGWVVEERKENGDRVMRLTLQPDGHNKAAAPAGGLKPMVLMPLFE